MLSSVVMECNATHHVTRHNLLEPSRLLQACNGIAVAFYRLYSGVTMLFVLDSVTLKMEAAICSEPLIAAY
jgi:hypothetical protein